MHFGSSRFVLFHLLIDSSSFTCGLAGALASNPVDVVRTRMMNQRVLSGGPMYKGTLDGVMQTWRNEGFFALYKGFWPNWLRLGPWNIIVSFNCPCKGTRSIKARWEEGEDGGEDCGQLVILILLTHLFSWMKVSVLHHLRAAEEASVLTAEASLLVRQFAGLSFTFVLFYLFTSSSAVLSFSLSPLNVEESHKFEEKKHSTNAVLIKDAKYVIFFSFILFLLSLSLIE